MNNNATSFILGIVAGYLAFTETGKKIVNNVANTAISSAMPVSSNVLNTLTSAVNGFKTPAPTTKEVSK